MNHDERKRRREQVVRDLKRGDSVGEVADRYGLSPAYVRGMAPEYGVSTRTTYKARGLRVLAQYCRLGTGVAAAEAAGVSRQYVSQIVRCAKDDGLWPYLRIRSEGKQ